MWLVFFLIFSFWTFCFFIRGVLDYLEYDVVSKIRVHNEESLVYPVITLCDVNPFPTQKAVQLLKEFEKEKGTIWSLCNNEISNISLIDAHFKEVLSEYIDYENYGMNKAFYLDEKGKKSLGHDLNEIVKVCTFNGYNCLADDFSWFFHYQYGNCFQFYSKENLSDDTKPSGSNFGLYISIKNLKNFNNYSLGHDMRVFIHNSSLLTSSGDQILVET